MVNTKNLIRDRLKLALRSGHKHIEDDSCVQGRLASLWHEDCYGYITALFDAGVITFHEYDVYTKINDKIQDKFQ